MKYVLLAVFYTALCSNAFAQEMKVDGTTKETYERSIKAMAKNLSEDDKEIFGRGLINLIVTGYPPAKGAEGLQMLQFMEPAVAAAHITLDGVFREEILAKGREVVAANAAKTGQKTEVNPDADVRLCLQDKVITSNVVVEKGDYGRNISMDVTNNLPWAIAGIRVNYIAFSNGRSVPWAKDDFSLSISGGIEPGETRKIATSLSLFPSDAPDKLNTTAIVLDVADPLERQLIRDVRVMGWGEEKSPMICE